MDREKYKEKFKLLRGPTYGDSQTLETEHDAEYLRCRPSWENVFLKLAHSIARRSHDAETNHGAVLTTMDNRIISLGFNGFPPAMNDDWLPNTRPHKYPLMRHAEINAISNAANLPPESICYLTGPPCNDCLVDLHSNGVRKVVYPKGAYSTVQPEKSENWVREVILNQSRMKICEVNYHDGWADSSDGLIWEDVSQLKSYLNFPDTWGHRVALVSGGFDPCHLGHLRLIQEARTLGQVLVVIVNGDGFLKRKKGFAAIPEKQRCEFMAAQKGVDHVLLWDDGTQNVAGAIKILKPAVFCNGGDRSTLEDTCPEERAICKQVFCRMELGVGGNYKLQSSSEILAKASEENRS